MAEKEFKQVAAQFGGQKPYLVIRDGSPVVSEEKGPQPGKPVEAIHILVWNPDDQKVVRLNVPFWLMRMTKGHPIKLVVDAGFRGRTRCACISRPTISSGAAPGLILDHKEASGERVLVWAQ